MASSYLQEIKTHSFSYSRIRRRETQCTRSIWSDSSRQTTLTSRLSVEMVSKNANVAQHGAHVWIFFQWSLPPRPKTSLTLVLTVFEWAWAADPSALRKRWWQSAAPKEQPCIRWLSTLADSECLSLPMEAFSQSVTSSKAWPWELPQVSINSVDSDLFAN